MNLAIRDNRFQGTLTLTGPGLDQPTAGTWRGRLEDAMGFAASEILYARTGTVTLSPDGTPAPPPEPPPPPSTDRAFALRVIALTNAERMRAGVTSFAAHPSEPGTEIGEAWFEGEIVEPPASLVPSPVTEHPALTLAAERYAQQMSDEGFFSHTGPDGSTPGTRARAAGYLYWSLGENLGLGHSTPEHLVQSLMNSPGHRANILNPAWREIGVGRRAGYTVQMFGVRRGG